MFSIVCIIVSAVLWTLSSSVKTNAEIPDLRSIYFEDPYNSHDYPFVRSVNRHHRSLLSLNLGGGIEDGGIMSGILKSGVRAGVSVSGSTSHDGHHTAGHHIDHHVVDHHIGHHTGHHTGKKHTAHIDVAPMVSSTTTTFSAPTATVSTSSATTLNGSSLTGGTINNVLPQLEERTNVLIDDSHNRTDTPLSNTEKFGTMSELDIKTCGSMQAKICEMVHANIQFCPELQPNVTPTTEAIETTEMTTLADSSTLAP